MNHCEGECQYAEINESMMKDFYGNLLKGFNMKNEIRRNNKNCKFNLKRNRKFLRQNSQKRFRTLNENSNYHKDNEIEKQENIPPKAPENRTQFLTSFKRNFSDISNEDKIHNFSKSIFSKNEKSKKEINKNALKENFISNNNYLEQSNFFMDKDKESQNNFSNTNTFYSNCLEDLENGNDLDCNHLNLNLQEEDFYTLTGSTMKTIVESITKSKNKILSNSLNLDGNQSNQCNYHCVDNEEDNSPFISEEKIEKNLVENVNIKEKEELEKAKNFYEMKFNIKDFIPDLLLEFDDNNTINTNLHYNNNYSIENINLINSENCIEKYFNIEFPRRN